MTSIPRTRLILLVLFLCGWPAFAEGPREDLNDYCPDIEPYQTGYLKVSDLHEIYYELCGHPQGKPVMILHGGPGGEIYPTLRRFHDPTKYLIVLHEQRGCGKSRPRAELQENTTANLVEDVERLRKHLELGKVQVFGGSWGSTLALAYAQKYPDHVGSLVLYGVFTCTKAEIDHTYHGGAAAFFPRAFEEFQSILPHPETHNYPQQLLDLLRDANVETRRRAALAWTRFELKASILNCPNELVESFLKDWDPYDFVLLESYYTANRCFLKEGQLLRNAPKIRSIPTVIVQGRYDAVCPPLTAYRLHEALSKSKLNIVEAAGHGPIEPRMSSALIDAVKMLE
jgi:proline iminopeptidase